MSKFKINDMIDDIVKEYRKKVEQALKRAERITERRIKEIIKEYMLEDYYNGYDPRMYVRIHELEKSVGPYTEIKEANNVFGLGFGVEIEKPYGPSAMNHKKTKVKIIYKRKKKPGVWEKTYTYNNKHVDENRIFENFLAGIHPNALGIGIDSRMGSSHIEESVEKALDDFFDNELMKIVEKEIDSIK